MNFIVNSLFTLIACVSLVCSKDRNNKPYRVGCYYASWAADASQGENKFTPEDLNADVCTHLNIAFATLEKNTIQFFDPDGLIRRVTDLRKKNAHLTVLISIGGWADGSTKYSETMRSQVRRQTFVRSVVDFLGENDLDGLDFDWEFPTFFGEGAGDRTLGRPEDKQDFITLLQELKEAFAPHDYILTGAISTAKFTVDRAYEIANVSKNMDFINLMTYDYHGPWSEQLGYNSPLHPDPNWSESDSQLTIEFTVDYFLQNGADPTKLVIGIPLYGYSFQFDGVDSRVGANATNGRDAGTYAQICQKLRQEQGWKVNWDEVAQVPFAIKGNQWITYDNLQSIGKKLDYIKQKHLGGAMVWLVNGDDWKGQCGEGTFPAMNLIMKTLNDVSDSEYYHYG